MALVVNQPRAAVKRTFEWAGLTLVLNAVWEVAQLPLYTLARDPDRLRIARHVIHCLAGDVAIASLLFLFAGALLRDTCWFRRRPWRGGAIVAATGVSYTAFSEWRNVYVTGAWGYSALMPTVGGIGLAPLLQWLIVPALAILLARRVALSPDSASGTR